MDKPEGECPQPDLVAQFAFDPDEGVIALDETLADLKSRAQACGYPFDRHSLRNELQAATFLLDRAADVRVHIAPSGKSAIVTAKR